MKIQPAQDIPEIKIIAENFQEANWLLKLLLAVQEGQNSNTYNKFQKVRDILLEM